MLKKRAESKEKQSKNNKVMDKNNKKLSGELRNENDKK